MYWATQPLMTSYGSPGPLFREKLHLLFGPSLGEWLCAPRPQDHHPSASLFIIVRTSAA